MFRLNSKFAFVRALYIRYGGDQRRRACKFRSVVKNYGALAFLPRSIGRACSRISDSRNKTTESRARTRAGRKPVPRKIKLQRGAVRPGPTCRRQRFCRVRRNAISVPPCRTNGAFSNIDPRHVSGRDEISRSQTRPRVVAGNLASGKGQWVGSASR